MGAQRVVCRGTLQLRFRVKVGEVQQAADRGAPQTGDFAFIRAWKADTFGNLQFRMAQRNFNPVMAIAAKTTVVEVESEIVPVGELDPDQIHVSGVYVDRLVKIPDDGIFD